jgi:hypothetical protein
MEEFWAPYKSGNMYSSICLQNIGVGACRSQLNISSISKQASSKNASSKRIEEQTNAATTAQLLSIATYRRVAH